MGLVLRRLTADGRKHFLKWYRNGRPRNEELFEAMKALRQAFKNALKIYQCNEMSIKKEILLSKCEDKKMVEFLKEVRKIKESTTVSGCIECTYILHDTVKEVLDNSECQAHSVAPDPMLRMTNFSKGP